MAGKAIKKHHWYFYAGITAAAIVGVAILLFAIFVAYLTATEYNPEPVEPATMGETTSTAVYTGEPLRLLTFNTGYAALGEEADFPMDGGKGVNPNTPELVEKNMAGIEEILRSANADFLLLQEVDLPSQRSYDTDQWTAYAQTLPGYEYCFAPNYRCNYVPYPVNAPLGAVDSGIATYSRFPIASAVRESLPVPFSWPLRVANLKRCLLVSRIPLADSDKELVIVNLHLEAYDDGAGKIAQTQQLLQLLQEEYGKGNYVIAGGDFNQVFPGAKHEVKPSSQWVPGLLPEMPEGWGYLYDDNTPTCRLLNQPYDPADPLTQYYNIDGFIVSPNVEAVKVETLQKDFAYSDHNPVLLEVKLH